MPKDGSDVNIRVPLLPLHGLVFFVSLFHLLPPSKRCFQIICSLVCQRDYINSNGWIGMKIFREWAFG